MGPLSYIRPAVRYSAESDVTADFSAVYRRMRSLSRSPTSHRGPRTTHPHPQHRKSLSPKNHSTITQLPTALPLNVDRVVQVSCLSYSALCVHLTRVLDLCVCLLLRRVVVLVVVVAVSFSCVILVVVVVVVVVHDYPHLSFGLSLLILSHRRGLFGQRLFSLGCHGRRLCCAVVVSFPLYPAHPSLFSLCWGSSCLSSPTSWC